MQVPSPSLPPSLDTALSSSLAQGDDQQAYIVGTAANQAFRASLDGLIATLTAGLALPTPTQPVDPAAAMLLTTARCEWEARARAALPDLIVTRRLLG